MRQGEIFPPDDSLTAAVDELIDHLDRLGTDLPGDLRAQCALYADENCDLSAVVGSSDTGRRVLLPSPALKTLLHRLRRVQPVRRVT